MDDGKKYVNLMLNMSVIFGHRYMNWDRGGLVV